MALIFAILLAHIEVENELLLLGSPTRFPRMIILFVVVLIILALDLIVFEAYFDALLFSHMDTQSPLFR